jgi:glycosyltransferase involved in cell wall biosynthesis
LRHLSSFVELKALFLYSHLPGYFHNCLKELLADGTVQEILVLTFVNDQNAPFKYEDTPDLMILYGQKENSDFFWKHSTEFSPDIVYLSGWGNQTYNHLGRHFKAKGKPVVMGMDNQWRKTLKQFIGILGSPFFVRRNASHAWVSGVYQYEFARMLGFRRSKILLNLYTADTALFSKGVVSVLEQKKMAYPREFLFVGRFVPAKNVLMLVQAFLEVNREMPQKWTLRLVGNGPLQSEIPDDPHIIVGNFVQPLELVTVMQRAGAFCLPSIHENWGVVLHEAAAAGLPIVASDDCGAATVFVKDNFNGFQFRSGNMTSLTKALRKTMSLRDERLLKMANNSLEIAAVISPKLWAASFAGLLDKFVGEAIKK